MNYLQLCVIFFISIFSPWALLDHNFRMHFPKVHKNQIIVDTFGKCPCNGNLQVVLKSALKIDIFRHFPRSSPTRNFSKNF